MTQRPELTHYACVLAVQDLAATSAYFADVLGFGEEWREADDWRLLARGTVKLMIGRCPDERPANAIGDHSYFAYFHVDDVDALHAEIAARGAIIRQAPADKPWGIREMEIATPDGHRMVIGQILPRPA